MAASLPAGKPHGYEIGYDTFTINGRSHPIHLYRNTFEVTHIACTATAGLCKDVATVATNRTAHQLQLSPGGRLPERPRTSDSERHAGQYHALPADFQTVDGAGHRLPCLPNPFPASQRGETKHQCARDEDPAVAAPIAGTATEQQESAEADCVSSDHPLQLSSAGARRFWASGGTNPGLVIPVAGCRPRRGRIRRRAGRRDARPRTRSGRPAGSRHRAGTRRACQGGLAR
jgi:hypothetical protein